MNSQLYVSIIRNTYLLEIGFPSLCGKSEIKNHLFDDISAKWSPIIIKLLSFNAKSSNLSNDVSNASIHHRKAEILLFKHQSTRSTFTIMVKLNKNADAGNRTQINCLEGNYANRYTTSALTMTGTDAFINEDGCIEKDRDFGVWKNGMYRRSITRATIRQDGRAVQGAAFRSQSGLPGAGSNPAPVNVFAYVGEFFSIFIANVIQ